MSRVGITVEGGLLAADLVERIAAGDDAVKGQQAKDFDVEAGRLSAEIQAAFSDIRVFWDAFKRRREHAQTSAVTLTREGWAIPFLERLGYALRFQRARTLMALAGARRESPETIPGFEAGNWIIFWALDRSRRIWLQRLRGETQITKAGPEIRELLFILAATHFGRLVSSDTNTNFPRKRQRKFKTETSTTYCQ